MITTQFFNGVVSPWKLYTTVNIKLPIYQYKIIKKQIIEIPLINIVGRKLTKIKLFQKHGKPCLYESIATLDMFQVSEAVSRK